MSQNIHLEQRKTAISRLAIEASLPEIASSLGFRVISVGATPRALCPFHNDEHPSLYLYPSSRGGRAQFHCYSCGAHGDVFDLIKKQLNTDFQGALDWLSENQGVRVPSISPSSRRRESQPRLAGLEIAFELYKNQSAEEKRLLNAWSGERRLDQTLLEAAEVFAALPPKVSQEVAIADREQFDALEAAGLLRREYSSSAGAANLLPLELPPRDFFSSPRIIFAIRSERGAIVGFAGRALGDDKPKYLFSPGFPRGSTLYRWHKVRRAHQSNEGDGSADIKHVFVVEGLIDALRLESLGIDAVACLGSSLTADQVQLLANFARELDQTDRQLAVHLFLDDDIAGRRGTINATVKLLEAATSVPGLLVDVISPSRLVTPEPSPRLHDPDELFLEVSNYDEAIELLRTWSHSPMSVLLSSAIEVAPMELSSAWARLPNSQRLRAFRDVERRLEHRASWIALLDRVSAFESFLGRTIESEEWQVALSAFLRASNSQVSAPIAPIGSAERDADSSLIRAMQIAEASTQRREFPVDEGSWDRLLAGADATLVHLKDLLASADRPAKVDPDPMIAVKVPKPNGEFRLKTLPCPEVLTMQQYVLDELLRDYPNCPRFQRLIPGVRFSTATGVRRVETTGKENIVPHNGETVSFAYMLDMEVIEQRAAPKRTGMFRSYFDCWRDFIEYIDRRVAEFPNGEFHVARLDIRRFYDTLPRTAINAVLLPPVVDALSELADSVTDTSMGSKCAELFLPDATEPRLRAEALVDWLCNQSFEYQFEHPGTGTREFGQTLPQGPDLSAYLANISLFPLDRVLSEIVAQLDNAVRGPGDLVSRGGVYARYVDDMVIIARTAPDLARLRAMIEKELGLIGLQLNPKTEPLPVMNEEQVREWLTEKRGVGLGASGLFDGPPVHTSLSLFEPLADAGETDRGNSLAVLYDPSLNDPLFLPNELESLIIAVRQAPELRHAEQVACARHFWRSILKRDPSATPATATDAINKLWQSGQPRFLYDYETDPTNGSPGRSFQSRPSAEGEAQDRRKNQIVAGLLAWLDGVVLLLGSRPDRNPLFTEEEHQLQFNERLRMAALVNAGLCEHFVDRRLPIVASEHFRHMIHLKMLAIRCMAAYVSPASSPSNIRHMAGESRSKARLLLSLAEAQQSTTLIDSASWRGSGVPLGILFHEAIARLRIANGRALDSESRHGVSDSLPADASSILSAGFSNAGEADPLMPVKTSINDWSQFRSGLEVFKILDLWMPHAVSAFSNRSAEIALGTLVNLAPRRVVTLLEHRPALQNFALESASEAASSILPTPPGVDVPGLLGLTDGHAVVLRTDFWKKPDQQFSPSLLWESIQEDSPAYLMRSRTRLDPYRYLPPPSGTVHTKGMLGWLAKAFRSLADLARQSEEFSCPPTAVNLLGPSISEETAVSSWKVLGFCTPKTRVVGQAFLRHGTGGLALEPVLEQHSDLWRIGTAIADWLGRAETSRNLGSQRLSAHAIVTEEQDDWATEAMLRFSLCRLRGKGLSTRPLRLANGSNLPITVERLLRRLEAFPEDYGDTTQTIRTAHLIATLAEGRAIHTRSESRLVAELPGSGVALFADIVRGLFRADEELAERLPDKSRLPKWAPRRRPARALLALAQRFELLEPQDPERFSDPTINALAAGTRILAVESNLRAQALEFWSLTTPSDRAKFVDMPPGLVAWALDSEVVLHRLQTTSVERDQVAVESKSRPDWRNVRDLFQHLHRATLEGERTDWGALDGITPLGWLVITGALTGALSGEWRGSFADSKTLENEGFDLEPLSVQLALAGDGHEDPPWGDLRTIREAWGIEETRAAFETLHRLDVATGFTVEKIKNSRFHIERSRRGATEVQTSDGLRQLQGWAISWAKTIGENRGGIERVTPAPDELKAVFRWTETWLGKRLVGIGVVQPAMAALAGSAFAELNADVGSASDSVVTSTAELDESGTWGGSGPIVEAMRPYTSEHQVTALSLGITQATIPPARTNTPQEISDELRELQVMQEGSWSSRQEKSESHARVALLQWDVDSSYRHPAFELCNREDLSFDPTKPETWVELKLGASCAEARRRAILESALKACYRFKVDMLLLPEYSSRPETVAWLASNLKSLAPTTSVWAGTYRLPPGMSQTSAFADWSAVLELVLPLSSDNRIPRRKKYPAVGPGEIFCPSQTPLAPLFADRLHDLRSFTMELICSEVFLVTCPANLLPIARAQRALLRKFGVRSGGKDIETMIKKGILEDIMKFASFTGLSESMSMRRTILLVPAMTSRTADYTVLGQAAFLSSGLTTVFCNAVSGSYGHGQSCFIGHDCWQAPSSHAGLPGVEPYHGVRPGIFQLSRGKLGKEEQALVIADLDPFYAFEGKPRPQTLPKPLQLVAHLPIIEASEPTPGAEPEWCRCRRTQHMPQAGEFAPELLNALQFGAINNWHTTADDNDPGVLGKALLLLADPPRIARQSIESNAGWLRRRAHAYPAGHLADPTPWPPPVALDWLWVDSGTHDSGNYPLIEAPRYADPASFKAGSDDQV